MDLRIKEDKSWSFSDISHEDTNYASHGYHKYPAKFIPQIVEKTLKEYSNPGETVLDCFGGCGTTLVESKLNERNSIILDINPAAILITTAKRTAINPFLLNNYNQKLFKELSQLKIRKNYFIDAHPRLKYWFKKNQYNQLMEIFLTIKKINNLKIKIFYECCFSDILKKCSIWYSKSIKPMRDYKKHNYNPLQSFIKHLNFMTIHNKEYYERLKEIERVSSLILMRDARDTKLPSNSVDLIITSPPYATSYEYADLHQLTLLWFGFTEDMNKIKRDFIGSVSEGVDDEINGYANNIIKKLSQKDKRLSRNINKYYQDLKLAFLEMCRVLKKGKIAVIIVGDTEYKGVKIKNSKVSVELLGDIGFNIKKIIKRKLSSKTLTPYRDKEGKFTNSENDQKRKIYQYEYIIIARKP